MSDSQHPQDRPPIDPNKAFSSPLPPPAGSQAGAAPPRPTPQRPAAAPSPSPYPPYPPAYMPPVRPRHSFVRGILVTLATTIFGISLMLNIYLLFLGGVLAGKGLASTDIIVPGDSTRKIAVLPLEGVIMDEAAEKFDRLLKTIEKDKTVKALVVEIDSPGGSVAASDAIYERLRRFRSDQSIPVIVSMRSLATSGGYYVACAADHVVAQRSALTGNIGVLMPRYNLSEAMNNLGIQETTIASSGARFKNAGSMFKPEDPEETQYFLELIDEAFDQFKLVVETGREGKLNGAIDQIANGKVYTASQAMKLGLIDQVGYLDDAIAHAAKAAGISNYSAVRYRQQPGLGDLLFGAEAMSRSPNSGLTLHISPEMIDHLSRPRMMYLWTGR